MGDDHVDRLGVEALQGVKLTSTNRPCGLTIKFLSRESSKLLQRLSCPLAQTSAGWNRMKTVIGFPGDLSEGATPVPIPNTAVKPFSPDGTAR